MAVLNFMFRGMLFVVIGSAMAAPPVNLSDVGGKEEEALKKIKSIRNLKQGDLTFTEDHNQFNIKIPKEAGRIVFEVRGRSLPNRSGKILFTLNEGEYVKRMKNSKDKKWFMVQTFEKAPRRAWVPMAAVKMPTPKTAKEEKPDAIKPDTIKEGQ